MSKKSFKAGFESLLTGTEEVRHRIDKFKQKETRATFVVDLEQLDKIKAISYWERKMIKSVLREALALYIEKYQIENGKIQLPSKNL